MDKKQIVIADIFADEEIIARITGGEKEFYARLIKNTMHSCIVSQLQKC